MGCYSGGTMLNRKTTGYSFYDNFFSDLGRLVSWSGAGNGTAMLLFSGSLVLLALSLVPFFWFLPLHAPDRAGLLRVAAAVGLVSTMAMIGVGLTPYDRMNGPHNTALALWLATSLIAVSLHAAALATSRETPQWYALLSILVALLLAAYAVLAFSALGLRATRFGRGEPDERGRATSSRTASCDSSSAARASVRPLRRRSTSCWPSWRGSSSFAGERPAPKPSGPSSARRSWPKPPRSTCGA
jgi:hypothetical membrane protein